MIFSKRIRMGRLDEFKPGMVIEKSIMAKRIAVINDDGELFGIESDCKHMRASLASGKISNRQITCKWHGWKYDLESGKCLTVDGFQLKKYPVEIENGDIFLVL